MVAHSDAQRHIHSNCWLCLWRILGGCPAGNYTLGFWLSAPFTAADDNLDYGLHSHRGGQAMRRPSKKTITAHCLCSIWPNELILTALSKFCFMQILLWQAGFYLSDHQVRFRGITRAWHYISNKMSFRLAKELCSLCQKQFGDFSRERKWNQTYLLIFVTKWLHLFNSVNASSADKHTLFLDFLFLFSMITVLTWWKKRECDPECERGEGGEQQ